MAEIISYKSPSEFLKQNHIYIYGNYLAHYHLIYAIEALKEKKSELYEVYTIVDDSEGMVLCMWTDRALLIYSDKWSDDIVKLLIEKIALSEIPRISICGKSELIKDVFLKSNVVGEVFKNRFIEECEMVKLPKGKFIGRGRNAVNSDFERLVEMAVAYYQEEFRGKGARTAEHIEASVMQGIEEGMTYLWYVDDEVVSMVQRINDDQDAALLGSLYTRPTHRGRGYGYFLLHTVTEGLLNAGYPKCGLVSDAENAITRKIFKRVGYAPVYDWVLVVKDNSHMI